MPLPIRLLAEILENPVGGPSWNVPTRKAGTEKNGRKKQQA
jgi:hypothetical protein